MIPQHLQNKPRVSRDKQLTRYQHVEAFCHMMYVSDDERQVEWLWNSRDGVTPFCIASPTGKEMRHAYFGEDRFDPDYEPQSGDRIFVDCKPEMIRDKAIAYVERYWESGQPTMKSVMDPRTKEESVQHFIEEWTKPGSPHVTTVKS
jgi:hypothetical protein